MATRNQLRLVVYPRWNSKSFPGLRRWWFRNPATQLRLVVNIEVGSEHLIFFEVLAPSKRWRVYSPAFWLPSGCCNCQGCGGAAGQGREPMRCWVFRGDFFFLQNHWIWDILTRAFLTDMEGSFFFWVGSCELGCFFSRLEIHRFFLSL